MDKQREEIRLEIEELEGAISEAAEGYRSKAWVAEMENDLESAREELAELDADRMLGGSAEGRLQ